MSLAIIRSALLTKLATYAAAHNPVLTIAREGVPFTKPANNATFLEALIIPANTQLITTDGSRQRFFGTFMINIWTSDIVGPNVAETIVEELRVLFAPVPKILLPVSVETPLSASKALPDGAGYRILPCSLMYRMESN